MILFGERETEQDLRDREVFRGVFGTRDGQYVLGCMLQDLGVFDVTTGESAEALRNFGVRLLGHLGIYHERYIPATVAALMALPVHRPGAPQGAEE